MRFRTLLLALILGCGLTMAAGARQKSAVHKVSVRKNRGYKTNRANHAKVRKAKPVKSHRRPGR